MIRSVVLSTLLLVACSFAQSTWFGGIAIFGVVPDISLIVLIWVSYKNGLVEGPATGFLSGLAEDFLSSSPLGFHAFVKTAVASLTALLHGSFFIDRLVLPLVLGVAGTLAKALTAFLLYILFGSVIHIYSIVDRVLWIEAAYNGLISPLVFLALTPLSRFLVTEQGRG
jgi:rod shape-determining protein MreD